MWCGWGAIALVVALPGAAFGHSGTTMIIFHHAGHTGSHALCEALSKMSCVTANCSEKPFSLGRVHDARLAAQTAFALQVYRLQYNDFRQLAQLGWRGADGRLVCVCVCHPVQ